MRSAVSMLFALLASCFLNACSNNYPPSFSVMTKESVIPVRQGGYGYIEISILIPKGSYIYGNPKGPGIGKPTTVSLSAGKEFIFETPRYRKPEKYRPKGEKDHVWIYEKETGILVPFRISRTVRPSDYPVTASIDALLCTKSTCMPKRMDVTATIRVFPPDAAGAASGDTRPLDSYTYLPDSRSPGSNAPAVITPEAGKASDHFTPRYISSAKVRGMLQAILFGIIAGFILNFMPCVLPVVSLKIMSFVRHAGEDRGKVAALGLLFSLGILTSFAALGLLAAFLGYNWGELFQKRAFLVVMVTVTWALSLSMFGVYALNIPSFAGKAARERENPYLDSFFKGLLATLLATPCSGPFLGGTLAWALSRPPHIILIIFMSIGAGMSVPYIILSFNRKLLRLIPKPGDWLISFERIMGFFLAGTAVYLIGIMGRDEIMPMIWFLMSISLGLWIYGRYGSIMMPARSRLLSILALLLISTAGYLVSFVYLYGEKSTVQFAGDVTFSLAALNKNRDSGAISLVKFTADWCPNCILVEKTALYTDTVALAVRKHGVRMYTADITRENPEAQGLLSDLGSRSIPFLAVFPPGSGFTSPLCLRDIYSKEDVVAAIEQAAAP